MTTLKFQHCEFIENWEGEYPYSSYCRAELIGSGGRKYKFSYDTEINPRGETSQNYYRRFAENYIPLNYTLEELLNDYKEKYSREELLNILDRAKTRMEKLKTERPIFLSFYTQKDKRREWRKIHSLRKWAQKMLQHPVVLLQFELTNFDYL